MSSVARIRWERNRRGERNLDAMLDEGFGKAHLG
jgi:hypothetical protein